MNENQITIDNKYLCVFCGKYIKNRGWLKSHQMRCKLNPNQIDWNHSHSNKFKGKTYQQILGSQKSNQLKDKISKGMKGKSTAKQVLRKNRLSEENAYHSL